MEREVGWDTSSLTYLIVAQHCEVCQGVLDMENYSHSAAQADMGNANHRSLGLWMEGKESPGPTALQAAWCHRWQDPASLSA